MALTFWVRLLSGLPPKRQVDGPCDAVLPRGAAAL
jgi:hypothetical protein